jgi:hypothetical protein
MKKLMSKAAEYALAIQDKPRFTIYSGEGMFRRECFKADVTEHGRLFIDLDLSNVLEPREALEFAKWINETFGVLK